MKEQPSTVDECDYDIAFTKEYFDKVRSEAQTLGDVLMRTIIVLSGPDWLVVKESAKDYLRNVRINSTEFFFCSSSVSTE